MFLPSPSAFWLLVFYCSITLAKYTPPTASSSFVTNSSLTTIEDEPDARHNKTMPMASPESTVSVQDAQALVKQGQEAMAEANALIMKKSEENAKHNRVKMAEDSTQNQTIPILQYSKVSSKRTERNSTTYKNSFYVVPPELAKAARIMAEASPPPLNDVDEYQKNTESMKKDTLQQKDTFSTSPILKKADGLYEVVDDTFASYQFTNNGTESDDAVHKNALLAKRSASSWWMANIKQTGSSPFAPSGYKVCRQA